MSWPAPTGEPTGQPAQGPAPAGSFPPPQSQRWDAAPGQEVIATIAPGPEVIGMPVPGPARPMLAAINPRTGGAVRPWTIWVTSVLMFCGAVAVTVGLLLAMWVMASPWRRVSKDWWVQVDAFNTATWLNSLFPTEPAAGLRVLLAVADVLIAFLVAGTASVIGYYAFHGYRWTRIGGLVALGVSFLSVLLTPYAAISIGFVALAAVPLWLPPTTRFFNRWQLLRHPEIVYTEPIDRVFYGPLPRFQ